MQPTRNHSLLPSFLDSLRQTPLGPATPSASDRLLTPAEAAKFLAISERKLWDLTDAKKIRATLIPPRSKRYDLADLRDFINRCKGNDGHDAIDSSDARF